MDRILKRGCIGFVLACNVFAVSCNHKQEVTNATSKIEKKQKRYLQLRSRILMLFLRGFQKIVFFRRAVLNFL
ncbi:hypothetical protein D3C87_57710 [compost metagenome]